MTDSQPLTIRKAALDDWPRIWPLFKGVVATGDTYTVPPEVSEAEGRAYWMDKALAVYVAELDGKLVGTYCLRVNQPGLGSHVANAGYMVDPASFGHGIGSRMCQHSLAEARTKGFEAMQFNAVVSTNHRAVALWQRHGFAIIGTVPLGYKHRTLGPVDLYIMHRAL
jgi:L-amino acid N-acyltransferase YncA